MNNYYDEIIDEIKQLITDGQNDLAYSKILNELNMPYIPSDIEKKLQELYQEVKFVNRKTKVFDDERIEEQNKKVGGDIRQDYIPVVCGQIDILAFSAYVGIFHRKDGNRLRHTVGKRV